MDGDVVVSEAILLMVHVQLTAQLTFNCWAAEGHVTHQGSSMYLVMVLICIV